jgi:hypothetical protein
LAKRWKHASRAREPNTKKTAAAAAALSLIFSIIFYVLHALLAVTSYFIVCVYSLRKIAGAMHAYMCLYMRAVEKNAPAVPERASGGDSLIILLSLGSASDV